MTMTEKCRALVHVLQSAPPASAFLRRPPDNHAEEVPPGGRAQFPMELMLARIEGCTKLLVQAELESTPAVIDQAVEQVLLADVALVTGYLRCLTDDLSIRLNEGSSDLRGILEGLVTDPPFPFPARNTPEALIADGTHGVPGGPQEPGPS